MNIVEHYNMLIDENNDPVYDTEPLKKYMDKWDGQVFIDIMKLDKTKTVLEDTTTTKSPLRRQTMRLLKK